VLIAGEALITAHPAGRTVGPQLPPAMFNHDEAAGLTSLQALAGLSADVVLPGHGPPTAAAPPAPSIWPSPHIGDGNESRSAGDTLPPRQGR